MNIVKQNTSNCCNCESIAHQLHDMQWTDMELPETAGIKITVNNLNVTLRFAEKPKSEIQDIVLQVLVSSYKSRITTR